MNKKGQFLEKNRKTSKQFLEKNRKGQFYLLAAIVIVAVIIGFATVSNYTKKKSDVKVYDLGKELGIEGDQVLEYGTYSQLNEVQMDNLLKHFSAVYSSYTGEGDLYFIIGDTAGDVNLYSYYEVIGGSVDLAFGGTYSALTISNKEFATQPLTPIDNKVTVTTSDGIEYPFELKPGENFYFIIQQQVGEEKFVTTG